MKCVSLIAIIACTVLSSAALAADLNKSNPTLEYALVATASNMFNWSEFDNLKPNPSTSPQTTIANKGSIAIETTSLVRSTGASSVPVPSKNVEPSPIRLTDPGEVECNANYACAVPTNIVATLQVRSGFSKTNYLIN